MKACVLTIGNEILKGKTVNTNAAEIGRMLYFSGYEVYRGLTVPDVKEEIGGAFRSLIGKCDVIVSSGGLGPTFDDMTVASFAEEFKIPIVRDEGTYMLIKEKTEKRGLKMTKEREKMSLVPQGSNTIRNEVGTAPGIEYKLDSTRIYILPGVPSEMRPMLISIEKEIKLIDNIHFEHSIIVKGVFEATLAPFISDLMKQYEGRAYIKSHPMVNENSESVIEIDISAQSQGIESAKEITSEIQRKLRVIVSNLKTSS